MHGPSETKNNGVHGTSPLISLLVLDLDINRSVLCTTRSIQVMSISLLISLPCIHGAVASMFGSSSTSKDPCSSTNAASKQIPPAHSLDAMDTGQARRGWSWLTCETSASDALRDAAMDKDVAEGTKEEEMDPKRMARASRDVFRRGGPKVEQMGSRTVDRCHGDGDASRVALKELYALWRAPHAASRKHLMVLAWMPMLGLAKMQVQRGKLWRSMGFTHGKEHYFYVEEAVYLMQRASALVVDEETGVELSVQEAMMVMIEMGVSMDRYMAYVHLRRGGYVVTRHPAQWTLDRSIPVQSYLAQLGSAWHNPSWTPGRTRCELAARGQATAVEEGEMPSCKPNDQRHKRKREKASRRPVQKKVLCLNRGKRPEAWWPKADGNHPWLCLQQHQLPPLLSAGVWAISSAPTLQNFRPYPTYKNTSPEAGRAMIVFDVYHPNTQFSRRDCGSPSFHLSVAEGEMPDQDCIRSAVALTNVDLKLAVVDSGAVLYYSLKETVLPSL